MKKLLITGASGFLGFNLYRYLKNDYSIHATHHATGLTAQVDGQVRMDLAGSLRTVDDWIGKHGIEAMIHCAAMSRTGLCQADPETARRLNVGGTRALAAIAAARRIPFIFISTDLVYNSGSGPHSEDDADPHMVYSQTKFDAELEAFIACPRTIVLRCALIYGSDDGKHGSFLRENQADLDQGKILKLFTDQYRSPVWSRDIADAIHRILTLGINSQVYNVGGDTRINRYDLGIMAAGSFGWDEQKIIPVSMTGITADAPYLKDCSLNSDRLKNETGWNPTPLPAALKEVAAGWIQTA